MKCKICKQEATIGDKFCIDCGYKKSVAIYLHTASDLIHPTKLLKIEYDCKVHDHSGYCSDQEIEENFTDSHCVCVQKVGLLKEFENFSPKEMLENPKFSQFYNYKEMHAGGPGCPGYEKYTVKNVEIIENK